MRIVALTLIVGLTASRGEFWDGPPNPAWHGPGWYQIAYSIAIDENDPLKGSLNLIAGPFPNKRACEKMLPPNTIEPGLFTLEGDTRVEYWCNEEREFPPWLGHNPDG
jgi:hypothetical protein